MTGKLVFNTTNHAKVAGFKGQPVLRFTAHWGFVSENGQYKALATHEGCLADIIDGEATWHPARTRWGRGLKALTTVSDDVKAGIIQALRRQGLLDSLAGWISEQNEKIPMVPMAQVPDIGEFVIE